MKKTLALAAALLAPVAAHADVFIGYQVNPGDPINPLAAGTNTAAFVGSLGGPFVFNSIAGENITDPLAAHSLDVSIDATNAHLRIWVTSTGQNETRPLASYFAVNALEPGWTVTETTYGSANPGPYGTDVMLGTATFTGLGIDTDLAAPGSFGTITALFDIFTGPTSPHGSFLGTIKVSAIPEPSTLLLLAGAAMTAFGLGLRRRSTPA